MFVRLLHSHRLAELVPTERVADVGPDACGLDVSRAAPCLGKAGSITMHHVRAVHGSATNFSGNERRFLLFQYRAADAWPLLGFAGGI